MRILSRCRRTSVVAATLLVAARVLAGQAPTIAPGTNGSNSNNSNNASTASQLTPNGAAATAPESNTDTSSVGMPAEQLIQILRDNPEVMVEVKSVVADAAQEQGVSVQPDALTDEQVYAQIEASSSLRAAITQFLRARGYVSEADIDAARQKSMQDAGESTDFTRARENVRGLTGRGALTAGADNGLSAEPGLADEELPARGKLTTQQTMKGREPAQEAQPNITDEPSALHRPAPYNMRSLRDLYTQVPDTPDHLKRFGSDLFVVHSMQNGPARSLDATGASTALDVPLGPDYVLGPGDALSINVWGGVSQSILRVVDREGRITLPEAGPVQVAGLTMEKAQSLIGNAMQSQYRNAQVAVTVSQPRAIRIFVVGDVQRPGAYDLSALATPISALFAAGGPTAAGSLRTLRHYRDQKLIGEIDLYDFMLHGIRPGDDKLQGGDTLLVPPVGAQVAVYGAVRRPAIYELKDEKDLAAVLDNAGGLTVAASLTHITIDRVVANQHREEVAVEIKPDESPDTAMAHLHSTEVKDGDRVHIASVLPYSERVIYLQGHVARPGKIAYRDDMRLSDVLRSYQDLLPEPAQHGEIVRLVAPDLHPETMEFDVPDVLIGNANIALQPFDTVRVFGRYERDAPTVSVRGEVLRPGDYPMFEGMTAAQLIRAAGGFKRDALLDRGDLASYQVANGTRVVVQRQDVAIGDAVLKNDRGADLALKPGDVLTVHQLTGWNDIGASIVIDGEVAHPGSYGFQEGEHLSDVLRRAGGFRSTAYPEGAVLTRPEVATLEEKSREELIRQIESSAAAARVAPGAGEQSATLQLIQQQQDQVIARLRSQPASGRLVIRIDSDIDHWAGTPADIEVRAGDELRIPKRPGFILVTGQVYNASAITFVPGRSASWYLQRAGGATAIANRKEIFIVRANGDVVGRRSGSWYGHDVLSTRLNPGDTIVVPQKIIGPSVTWRNLLGTAQIIASLAIAAAVAGL
jgi:protein involved in polysaccharide export with SLBB domain